MSSQPGLICPKCKSDKDQRWLSYGICEKEVVRTTIEKSEILFNKLKKEGECWHKWDGHGFRYHDTCEKCAASRYNRTDGYGHIVNPDFFSPPSNEQWRYFGWLLKRAKNKDWWIWFLCGDGNGYYESPDDDVLMPKVEHLSVNLISCTALAEALFKWFENA